MRRPARLSCLPGFSLHAIANLVILSALLAVSKSTPTLDDRCGTGFGCRSNSTLCVARPKWQDGVSDCPDASDEECLIWQYDCKFGKPRCVDLGNLRDGSIDCMSGFDEECPAHFFVCMDRSDCIAPERYLDGRMDCRDGSDEPCPAAHFMCRDRSQCIPQSQFQDGVRNCTDGSDEECTLFQFECLCGEPRCIGADAFNDGSADCADGSDEASASDGPPSSCADGSPPRTGAVVAPSPPPTAPMVPCPSTEPGCHPLLGEMCVVIGGLRRCLCQMGYIRPAGSSRCIPAPVVVSEMMRKKKPREDGGPPLLAVQTDSDEQRVTSAGCDVDDAASCGAADERCVDVDGAFACSCRDGFVRQPRSGVCIALVDECGEPNDCDPNAVCMDNPLSYECLCRQGYIDMSAVPQIKPGMHCLPLVNECAAPTQNDCDAQAECVDLPGGYTCACRSGYRDASDDRRNRPGRVCVQDVDECAVGTHTCHVNAICTDTSDGFTCRCPTGFVDLSVDAIRQPGRQCAQLVEECADASDCDALNGECVNTAGGRVCRCKRGFVDRDRSRPGTDCSAGDNPCLDYSLHDCDPQAVCDSRQPGFFECRCLDGFVDVSPDQRYPGRSCKKEENECALGTHACSANADCVDTRDGYTCVCRQGWLEASADPFHAPGRQCKRGLSCADVQCAPEADCRESASGAVCTCRIGYFDTSANFQLEPGRACQQLVNECVDRLDDCSSNARCIDTADSFTCRCKDGYRDESPDPVSRPGRLCSSAFTPTPPECDVNDPLSCDHVKSEVCVFTEGTYKCQCPQGYSRLPDGRCRVINECSQPRLNDCAANAECIDQADSFTCRCPPGFADVSTDAANFPGRICRALVDECRNEGQYRVDCDPDAVCVDTDDSYTCRCLPGFADVSETFNMLPGRRCVEAINECLDPTLNDCSPSSVCEDAKVGYTCRCRQGFVDASANTTHYPGRVCNKPKPPNPDGSNLQIEPCEPNNSRSCRSDETCADTDRDGVFVCECAPGTFRFDDGTCRVFSACENSVSHDCDTRALCSNVFDSFACQCRPGFVDLSPDPYNRPGRVCRELINECADVSRHDCSPFAMCLDARDGYACMCMDGFVDVSSEQRLPPGRRCHNASNECAVRSLHSCDDNADCVDTTDGYACQCFDGFIDVSSNANLPPGRVCTVQTTCPKQATDLMFLIDGSGSIGSFVFKNEVLRFVREFVELFDVGADNTRVGVIQYSDQIRHEFDLGQYGDMVGVLQGISSIEYLTGLTRTGAAIEHMVHEGFSLRRGARPRSDTVARVAIVITDGRSQDNVSDPAQAARQEGIQVFAIGVTDHVLLSELTDIAGDPRRKFHVHDFTDLDTRLRSIIQKAACPNVPPTTPRPGTCDPTGSDCDRTLNEVCRERNGQFVCDCPDAFMRHPLTRVCGGRTCNPALPSSCDWPEVCTATPYGNYRCVCPDGYFRHRRTGFCVDKDTGEPPLTCRIGAPNQCPANEVCQRLPSGKLECVCSSGLVRDAKTAVCVMPGSCNPNDVDACDQRKRLVCLPQPTGAYHTCQCPANFRPHSVTGVCLMDECATGQHDCHSFARCINTDDGFLCACPVDFIDLSPDKISRPGRVCVQKSNECKDLRSNNCSENALCTDTDLGYVCSCKPGYVDFSDNPNSLPGQVCKEVVNECANSRLNTCHQDAICVDSTESYTCFCKDGFIDLDELRNPGRVCQREHVNDRCLPGNNDCDKNARCVPVGDDGFNCACPVSHKDKSPDPFNLPGRICIPVIPECQNPSLNDCDLPDRADCIDTDEGFLCRCKAGFLDISTDPLNLPGRTCQPLIDECELGLHDCARPGGICEDTPDAFTCRCSPHFLDVSFDRQHLPGRACKRKQNECADGSHDCSPNARCTDTDDSFVCSCNPGFHDTSDDPLSRPGRKCLRLVNECANGQHDCSSNAECTDTVPSFLCRCFAELVDESPDPLNRPGRICRPREVNECALGQDDCSPNAVCEDLPDGYTCRCLDGFLDESPNGVTQPGRHCTPRPTTPPPDECRIDQITSCEQNLNEVCRLVNGEPKCACPENYRRHADTNACTVINECLFPRLHDCSQHADCFDKVDGFTCRCKEDFKDNSADFENRPGRTCKRLVNECEFDHLNDCHQFAVCTDLEEGFSCACPSGYFDLSADAQRAPGRICRFDEDECSRDSLNSCDANADCVNEREGYRCECRQGFFDISPSAGAPGRVCKPIKNECLDATLNDCHRAAICKDTLDSYECECPADSRDISPNPAFPGRVCLVYKNECLLGEDDCDENAICRDTEDSFTCECAADFTDRSPNQLGRPGRVCKRLIDECADGRDSCHEHAECRDLIEAYTCECRDGYVDRSPDLSQQPGRVCVPPDVCQPNHECSAAAVCEPLGGGDYRCVCIQGYVDRSPDPNLSGRICVIDNECRDPKLNLCSRNAICYDKPDGYLCECVSGYEDKSPNTAQEPGRICEPKKPPPPQKKGPCQDPALNECSLLGTCRSIGTEGEYTCECPFGYADRSPDLVNKPGRTCVPQTPLCRDTTRNTCHPFAICTPVDDEREYTCRCRDGYYDVSPDANLPGRLCEKTINECLDASLNDCAPIALCEDRQLGYTCRCPVNSIDKSPDAFGSPGRVCQRLVDECQHPHLNNCSANARCLDEENGYRCLCIEGYHDNMPSQPGRRCELIINECLSLNLNDCDRHADCIDLEGGFSCQCRAPYRDESTDPGAPGRICRLNECADDRYNDCDRNAVCQDTDEAYVCSCLEGFIDISTDQLQPGRVCLEASIDSTTTTATTPRGGLPCGPFEFCFPALNEVCIGGTRCGCRPGEARRGAQQPCVLVVEIQLPMRVVSLGNDLLFWSTVYGDPSDPRYIEIVSIFEQGVGDLVIQTAFGPQYVKTVVDQIKPPRLFNSSWENGLMFNYTVSVVPGTVERCELWRQLTQLLRRQNLRVGSTDLTAAEEQMDPCAPPGPVGPVCGAAGVICNVALGEVCIAKRVCDCPRGKQRRARGLPCVDVEAFVLPLWVIRRGFDNLAYNDSFANPDHPLHQVFVELFELGVAESYGWTTVRDAFVALDVIDIVDPRSLNGTWNTGILYNFTTYFERGAIRQPTDVWYELLRVITANSYEVGSSGLFINPYQANPFSSCFHTDCHPTALCIERGPNSYTCQCADTHVEKNPSYPGRECQPKRNHNECLKPDDNECSAHARCIDEEFLYRCECLPGYVDASPANAVHGSVCRTDFCSDLHFCPENSTCVNEETRGDCQCHTGFVDVRASPKRVAFGLSNKWCLRERDVDECALQLTDCSAVAECRDLVVGYDCVCPAGFIDGNPEYPGRLCGGPLCARCNGRGDCVHDTVSRDVYCKCHDGYQGDRCEVAPADIVPILVIILAIIFLLLTLCCLLYFCLKCRCFKGRGLWYREPLFTYRKGVWPWSTLEQHSSSSESGADFSGMSSAFGKGSDYYPDMAIPRAKLARRDEQRHLDASQLSGYLDDGMRIPRPRVSDSAERDGSEMLARRATRGGGGGDYESSVDSESSSEYTMREEVERRVITDVKKSESKTVTADVHGMATAEFHVYPPVDSRKKDEAEKEVRVMYESSALFSPHASAERDRGQSVAEFSVGGVQRDSDWGAETATTYQDRALSEYSDRDMESISEESQAGVEDSQEGDVYDKKVLVTKSRDWLPDEDGRGAGERFKTHMSTKTNMRETSLH